MSIQAIALLKLDACEPNPESGMRVEALEDAVLVHTGLPFSSDPEELAARLRAALGAALEEHDDPRGIFVLPDVAKPMARSYVDVLDEVGEGGAWHAHDHLGGSYGLPDGLGALGAVLGSMLQNMPESVLEAASAAARGDMAAFNQVSDQVASLMGHGGDNVSLASLARLVGDGRALDPTSPAFQQILHTLEGELEKDPEQVARLAEQFFGGREPGTDED
jgi:hypothetical protein